jgi:hypothetical protein
VRSGQPTPAPAVDEDNRGAILAPTFSSLARVYGADPNRLRAVITRAHYPMPEPAVDGLERSAVVDYILSLRYPTVQR